MEYGGIAHRLKDNSTFLCLAKMLVAVIRTTILARALWVGVPSIETNAKEGAVLLVACLPLINQMNELNQAFEDYFLNSNNIWTV